MIMRDPTVWRWSHARHHTDTIIVGRDPEIVAMRPPALGHIAANFIGMFDVPLAFKHMAIHASGRLTDAGSDVHSRHRAVEDLLDGAGLAADLRGSRGGVRGRRAASCRRW